MYKKFEQGIPTYSRSNSRSIILFQEIVSRKAIRKYYDRLQSIIFFIFNCNLSISYDFTACHFLKQGCGPRLMRWRRHALVHLRDPIQ